MLRSKKRYLGALCVASCIVMFAAACSSSDNNGGTEAAGSTTANETQEAAEPTPTTAPTPKPTPTPRPEPTPTPEPTQTVFNGPHGITIDINDFDAWDELYRCYEAHEFFTQNVLSLAIDLALDAYDDTDFGNVWYDLGEVLIEEFYVISELVDCEEDYPRLFNGFYTDGLFDVIDDCSLVSNYSSASEDNACENSLERFERISTETRDRFNDLDEFAGEVLEEVEGS